MRRGRNGDYTKYTDFLDYIITFRGYYARVYQGQVKPRCDADKGDYFEKLFSDKKNHYKVEALQAMEKDNLWIDYFIKVREQHLKNKENWIDFGFDLEKRAIKMPIGLNEPLRRTIWSLVLMNICRRIVELQRLILLNLRSFISGFIKEQAMNTRSGCWQITNLVKILGEDAVIEKTYGNNPSIVFQKQSPAEKIENSKFDLLRDIGRVRRLCEMPEASARVLLDKIDTKINDRDLEYFGTQVEVIDLFDALQRIGLGERYKDDLYHIAVSLVEEVGCEPKQFNEEDWSCGEYDGSFGPDADTAAFIKEINSFNWIYQNAHEQEHTDEEDDIFSKYEYLFHSDGEVREPTFKRVWEDFRKACSEGAYSQKKLWDFMRSIVLGPAQNIAYGTIRKFRQETDDPIEIVQLTELMYEVEANEYMESVAENLHNKLD